MRELDWDNIRKAKDAYRDGASALPFDEKLRVMERLRTRAIALMDLRGPVRPLQGDPASNMHVFVPQPQKGVNNVRSSVNLALFGATAALVAAMTSAQSGAVPTVPRKSVERTR